MVDFKEKIVRWTHKIAEEQKFESGYKIEVQQVTGVGYSSLNFKISISEPSRELKLFAKIANINADLRNSPYIRLYTDELYFYMDIAKVFRGIENHHNIPEEHKFLMTMYYGGDPTPPEETIILEDLTHKGFTSFNQELPFDWEFASKAVEQLAKFHALSFVYGVECSSEFAKVIESKLYHVFDSPIMKQLGFEQTVPTSVAALGAGDLQERVRRYLAKTDRHDELVHLYRSAAPRVLAHGDFKTNNLMQRHHENKLEVIPVDFQNIHAGSPVTDLLYLVMLGSDEAFRASSLDALRNHYYEQLTLALKRMAVNIKDVYPRHLYEEDWKHALPIGLAVALMILPYVLPTGDQDGSTDAAFAERVRGVVRDYVRWGIL